MLTVELIGFTANAEYLCGTAAAECYQGKNIAKSLSVAMDGGHDPDCRKTMPWQEIAEGKFTDHQAFTKALIALRNTYPQLREETVVWHHDEANPRLVCYDRPGQRQTIRVYLNNTDKDIPISADPVFTYRYENAILKANGILICRIK